MVEDTSYENDISLDQNKVINFVQNFRKNPQFVLAKMGEIEFREHANQHL